MSPKNLCQYPTSKDYDALYRILKEVSVICIVDYEHTRDVCTTSYFTDPECIEVNGRGMGYIYADDREEFIEQCKAKNLEYIVAWDTIDNAPCDGTEILATDYDSIEIIHYDYNENSYWSTRGGDQYFPSVWLPLPVQPELPDPKQLARSRAIKKLKKLKDPKHCLMLTKDNVDDILIALGETV